MHYPGKGWEAEGYKTISWIEYTNAIDKVAYWLDDQLGKTTQADTVTFFGPNEPRVPCGEISCLDVISSKW